MRPTRLLSLITCVSALAACTPPPEEPSGLTEKQLPGESFYPEGIASGPDGTLYFSSVGTGAIARARPGELGASVFVPGRPAFGVYGMAVDTAHDTLWACTYDDTLPPAQPSHLAAYSLTTGAQTLDLVMPGESGGCNDVTLDAAGNVYATDSFANTIVRLPVGGSQLETWASDAAFEASEPGAFTLNGLTWDGGNTLYVVKTDTGDLFSIAIQPDGSAGAPVAIPVSPALETPDGLEWVDDGRLLVVENSAGRASLVTLAGGSGTKEVLANDFLEPTAVALTQEGAWVLESQLSILFGQPGLPSLPFRARRIAVPPAPLLP
ncbi:hypothetical protein KH5H1_56180 [Corallococcus caeni]|uniref:SMP-30/gluconolactonase/LRE family protein n=1 Tax=Corallococcus caeni TaxID=3082388 RepID=UPI0029563D69|nr:hypothetical protein KH5H1_56180 [Corallococcus sp. KH5-1]